MDKSGIEELLIDCVLHPELLRRVRASPDSVFAEYELTDDDREILASADTRMLELLGRVVHRRTGDHQFSGATERMVSADMPAQTPLPESRLVLRFVPYLQQSTEADGITGEHSPVTVNYAAHLDQLPDGTGVEDLPEVPPAALPGLQLDPLAVVVAIQPSVWTDAAGNQQVIFSVNARLPQESAGQSAPQDLTPWRHDVNSPAVKAAAARVRDADSEDRYKRLLDLIEVMVAPAPQTETGR